MSRLIHVAIGSTMSIPGDVGGNLAQIRGFAEQAGRDGVDLLLTPEMSASGYGPYAEVIATAEPAGDGHIYRALAEIASVNNVVVAAGFVESASPKLYLAHYIVYPSGEFVVQRKHRITKAELPLDSPVELVATGGETDPMDRGQPANTTFNYFDVKGVKCALAICADSGIKNLNDTLATDGIELLLVPVGAGGAREDRFTDADFADEDGRARYLAMLEKVFFPGRGVTDCIKYRRGLVAVNMCGYDGRKHYHLGHGMIINLTGEVVGFFHGQPNLDRQRPMYAHGVIDVDDTI